MTLRAFALLIIVALSFSAAPFARAQGASATIDVEERFTDIEDLLESEAVRDAMDVAGEADRVESIQRSAERNPSALRELEAQRAHRRMLIDREDRRREASEQRNRAASPDASADAEFEPARERSLGELLAERAGSDRWRPSVGRSRPSGTAGDPTPPSADEAARTGDPTAPTPGLDPPGLDPSGTADPGTVGAMVTSEGVVPLPSQRPAAPRSARRLADVGPVTTPVGVPGGGAAPPAAGGVPLETMIGQMLMVGFVGDDVGQAGPTRIAEHIRAGRLGGVLFFKQNVKSAAAVQRLTKLFQDAAPPGRPVLLAVDQEGGRVQRLTGSVGFASTPSAEAVAAQGTDAASRLYQRMANGLAAWGFNVNLGPVVDIRRGDNPVIGRLERAYSGDTDRVADFAKTFVEAHRAAGVLTSLKHFPGHGSSAGDTHHGFVDVSNRWSEAELKPFEAVIDRDLADMVMVAHVHLAPYGPGGEPASLSPQIIRGLLRGRLGFEGVVISDDMEMGAIRALGSPLDIAARAIAAGNDILVYAGGAAGKRDLVRTLQDRLQGAARDPQIRARIEESYRRILAMKSRLGR